MASFWATMAAHGADVPTDLSDLGVCTSTLRADPFSCSPDDLQSIITASGLAEFADRAAGAGRSLSIEWLPWTVLPPLSSAWQLIESVDRANVGLVFDNWHWLRQPGGPQPDVLRTIPGDREHLLQLCDAP